MLYNYFMQLMYTYRELISIDIRKNWSTILLSYLRDPLIIEVSLSPSVVPYSRTLLTFTNKNKNLI